MAVDGRHYCEYRHRRPCRTVDTLHIQGDVKISSVEFKSSAVYPSIPAALMASISPSLSTIQPVNTKRRILLNNHVNLIFRGAWRWACLALRSPFRLFHPLMNAGQSAVKFKCTDASKPFQIGNYQLTESNHQAVRRIFSN